MSSLRVSGVDLLEVFEDAVAVAEFGVGDHDPWIGVEEDSAVLFCARRIG